MHCFCQPRAAASRRAARPATLLPLFIATLATLCCAGCGSSMHWYYDRNTAELDAKRDAAPRFVYFRSPFSVACTKFEDTALHDPEVIRQTADMLCIMLSYDFDKQIAATWGVKSAPGIAILAPDDTLLASRSGEISTDDVLKALQTARDALQRAAERKKPAGPATSRPLVAP